MKTTVEQLEERKSKPQELNESEVLEAFMEQFY